MDSAEPISNPAQPQRTWWKRVRRAIILYIVLPYLAVTILFVALQRRLMYRPSVAADLSVAQLGLDDEFGIDVELKTVDGNVLRGWLVYGNLDHRAKDGTNRLVLYFPGNALNRADRINDLREVASRGFDVLIFDYRGFGDSTGSPSEAALSADALLVWQYACETLGYHERNIVVFGESIGGAVALSLWSNTNPKPPQPQALVLNSTFASMTQTVRWHYPLFPFHLLLLDRWPSIDRIGRVSSQVIVFHGTDDEIVPIDHARALAKASSQARFIVISGGTHNNIPLSQLHQELDPLIDPSMSW